MEIFGAGNQGNITTILGISHMYFKKQNKTTIKSQTNLSVDIQCNYPKSTISFGLKVCNYEYVNNVFQQLSTVSRVFTKYRYVLFKSKLTCTTCTKYTSAIQFS